MNAPAVSGAAVPTLKDPALFRQQCYVNGEPQRVGLLSDLRLAQHARGGTLVARGFRVLRALHEADPVPYYLTAILDGNQRAGMGSVHDGSPLNFSRSSGNVR